MKRHALNTLLVAATLLSWSAPVPAQPARPVELTRLGEREAWEAVERASPDQVFLVRGRRVTAGEMKQRLPRLRAAAEERRRRLQALAQPHAGDPVEELRRLAEQRRRAAEPAQREFIARQMRELRAAAGPDTPEIRNLRTEAVRLGAQWLRAAPEERPALERRFQEIQEQLRRLGAPL
jgi:hypothetical protein